MNIMTISTPSQELVFIISSLPEQNGWVLLHGNEQQHFPDRRQGKTPGLVDAIRHCFWAGEGRPSLLLIQHGGQQFRLRFHNQVPGEAGAAASRIETGGQPSREAEPVSTLAQLCTLG